MFYEERIVAFIDILGFKNAVFKSNNNNKEFLRILNAITELKKFFTSSHYDLGSKNFNLLYDTQIIQISDSLIISRPINEPAGVYYMLEQCAHAIHLLIDYNFLCRGAIKAGNLYHKGNIIFGEAFIHAFEEETNEPLPIIKFEKDLFDLVKKNPSFANKGNEEWEIEFIKDNCAETQDGKIYIDYFRDYRKRFGTDEEETFLHYLKLRETILEGLLNCPKTSSAYSKCKWAAQEFNLVAKYYNLEYISSF